MFRRRRQIRPIDRLSRAVATVLVALATPVIVAHAKDTAPERRAIDIAICLDTSGSMDGLIDAAKEKLWAVVNDLALAEPTPDLRVALVTFGNDGHVAENGWVSIQAPFTRDLDLISEQLFSLTTNGGTEYVARVLRTAEQLDWRGEEDDGLRLAIVAGNESAEQDPNNTIEDVCHALIARGVLVNAIYCGPATDHLALGWKHAAVLADGQFAVIDQDHGTVAVDSPFDQQLNDLSASLNETYVPFGSEGDAGATNQRSQDANATGLSASVAASRAATKASALYSCSWDLVDACKAGSVDLGALSSDELPARMREMTPEERVAYIDGMQRRRAEIQGEIQALSTKRDAFVAEEIRRLSLDDSKALDHVVRQAVRGQAESKGFRFDELDGETVAATP